VKLLALDTSSHASSVAIQLDNQIKVLHEVAPMQQAKQILPMIEHLLSTLSIKIKELDAIAYGCGPGSFTGVRIANSVAQGIGFAINKPLIPISSLAAVAQAVYQEKMQNQVMVAFDARMKKIYWATYVLDTHDHCMKLVGQEQACAPETIPLPEAGDWCAAGDGWSQYQEALIHRLRFQPKAIYATQLPTAQAILSLAKRNFEQRKWIDAKEACPVYLMHSQAQ
jgi:tRNA threonylcarbamoyladenosine biosynthesis protein TsaB